MIDPALPWIAVLTNCQLHHVLGHDRGHTCPHATHGCRLARTGIALGAMFAWLGGCRLKRRRHDDHGRQRRRQNGEAAQQADEEAQTRHGRHSAPARVARQSKHRQDFETPGRTNGRRTAAGSSAKEAHAVFSRRIPSPRRAAGMGLSSLRQRLEERADGHRSLGTRFHHGGENAFHPPKIVDLCADLR